MALIAPAQAQVKAPKNGPLYRETTNIGFQVKTPAKWEVSPPGPEDGNLLMAYFPVRGKGMRIDDEVFPVGLWIALFDDTLTEEQMRQRLILEHSKTPAEWVEANIDGSAWKVDEKDYPEADFKCADKQLRGTATHYEGHLKGEPVCAFTVEFKLDEHRTLAIIGNGPGAKDWKPFEKSFRSLAKSFKRVELAGLKRGKDAKKLTGPRLERYDKILGKLPPGGEWRLTVAPSYYVASNCKDKKFIQEIASRMAAIRGVFEKDFPMTGAFKGKVDPLKFQSDDYRAWFGALDEQEQTVAMGELTELFAYEGDDIDPAVRSTMSTVKIFEGRQAFLDYCDMPEFAGYWWGASEELCLYDDKVQGRGATFDTLFHEAFHQYMFYFKGGLHGIPVHGWFSEGSADYYAGFEYKAKKVKPGVSKSRRDTIRTMIREGTNTPLSVFLTWYQKEYYGENPLGVTQLQNYAHGWSLVRFLRNGGKDRAKGWQSEWNGIYETYVRVTMDTGDSKLGLASAFDDVDLDALETSWRAYTLSE